MGEVRYSPRAAAKIKSLCEYYADIDPQLADKARSAIVESLNLLIERPRIGRPAIERPKFRERVIRFGSSHFLALYYLDEITGDVLVVAIRHEREMGYPKDD
jgi:plasmid stabilization system protein ParE